MYPIEVCDKWHCRWPRPTATGATVIHLRVLKDGAVEFCDIGRVRAECELADQWYRRLRSRFPLLESTCTVLGGDLLRVANADSILSPLAPQLVWRLSLRLQSLFAGPIVAPEVDAGRLGGSQVEAGTVTSLNYVGSLAGSERRKLNFIGKYVFNSIEGNRRHTLFGISTDKGSANALPLHQSVITTSDNRAMLSCPVVRYRD